MAHQAIHLGMTHNIAIINILAKISVEYHTTIVYINYHSNINNLSGYHLYFSQLHTEVEEFSQLGLHAEVEVLKLQQVKNKHHVLL